MKPALAALAVILISGCERETTSTVTTTPPAQSSPLALTLEAPSQGRADTAIHLKLVLRNTTAQPRQVMLGGRPPYDFVITSADGARSWRWSDSNAAQMILEARTLQPGDHIVYETDWRITDGGGNVPPPGRYRLRGILNMDPPETMETAPQELAVIAR